MNTLCIASDHGGVELKKAIKQFLTQSYSNIQVQDLGPFSADPCDYPDFADALVQRVLNKSCERGILICGTGIGISIRANRYKGIRAAVVHDAFTAEYAKKHNNANVLCLGARVLNVPTATSLLKIWLDTSFEGGRHEKRIEKLDTSLKQ